MTTPNELVTSKERQVLDWIVTRFLSEHKATTRRSLIHTFEDPELIDNMLKRSLLFEADRHLYLPSLLAFEFCSLPEAKDSAKQAAAIVIKTLQHLYRSEESRADFTFAEIKERASEILGIKDSETIWLGLFLSRELNILDSYSSKIDEIGASVVRPSEDIIRVKDFHAPWDRIVEARTAYWLPEGQLPARDFAAAIQEQIVGTSTNPKTQGTMFTEFLNERVTLVKRNGQRLENLPASVQPHLIFTQDPNIPIEDGDHFERQLPSGLVESFLVMDAGFKQGLGGIKPHYQSKVRKMATSPRMDSTNESGVSLAATPKSIDVFVSHSSADVALAKDLIDVLRVALPIEPKRIRCTSVDGYRLEGGSDANNQIRTEIWEARVFIGLLTPTSLSSTYVLFELGARWGAKLQLKPLVAAGIQPGELRAPLSSLNALSCDQEGQILQLIREIAENLGMQPHHVDSYLSNVRALVTRSKESAGASVPTKPRPQESEIPTASSLGSSALELIIAPQFIKFSQPGIAEFQMTVKLWNRGTQICKNYHLDVQVPAKLLGNDSATHWHELPDKRTAETRFFRFPSPDTRPAPVYPDDLKPIGTLTFYLDSASVRDAQMRRSIYVATLYTDTEKIVASKSIGEIFNEAKAENLLSR